MPMQDDIVAHHELSDELCDAPRHILVCLTWEE